jgi:DNA-binding SARP family transcriptional activator
MPSAAMAGVLGRMILVRLSVAKGPIARDTLIDALWEDHIPESVESVLNATCSRLRKGLTEIGLDGKEILISHHGSVEIQWPSGTQTDLYLAVDALEDAERAMKRHDFPEALQRAACAYEISQLDVLPGIERIWINEIRDRQREVLERSVLALTDIWYQLGGMWESLAMVKELLIISPYSQPAIQKVVRAYCSLGDVLSAHVAMKGFKERVQQDLGVEDFHELEDWFKELLPDMLIAGNDLSDTESKFGTTKTTSYAVTRTSQERFVFPPGWKWSVDIGPSLGETLCEMTHIGRVVSGQFEVLDASGYVTSYGPGEAFHIVPRHDMWVVGEHELVTDGW